MTRTILIGKGRRVTLEELQSVAVYRDAVLQVHAPEVEDCALPTPNVDAATAALSQLSIEEADALSPAVSIGAVTLLALNISQNRLMIGSPGTLTVVSSLVDLVNAMSASSTPIKLSTDTSRCIQTLLTVLPQEATVALTVPVVKRAVEMARAGLASIQAMALARAATPIAALSAERCRANAHAFAEARFDTNRPHRGLVTTAAALRAILNGSKYVVASKEASAVSCEAERIPEQHGPALESLRAVCKTVELELNCFESNPKEVLDDTVTVLAQRQALDAVSTLVEGSRKRTDSMQETNVTSLEVAVASLQGALKHEAKLGCDFCQEETARLAEEVKKKEEAKAARAAAAGASNVPNKKDEFEGLSEAKVAKILKKRAEKEAKAKKKAAAKQSKGVSPFGAGTMSVCKILVESQMDLTESVVLKLEAVVDTLLSGGAQRKPKIAKGTRDYLPEQMMIRQQAFRIIRRVFESHGAVEIDTPVFELKDTLTGKYGEDSKLIYDLADQGGELLALRYDLTVPFARFLALNSVGNIKRFHIGKVYRRDQPALSKGRYREFYQCDFDIAGNYGRMVPDSECVCVACEILDALPIGDFGIKLNHRRLLDAILDLCGVPAEKFRTICSAVDKLDKEPWEEVKREMVEDKGLTPEVADKIGKFVLEKGEPWTLYNALVESNKFGKHAAATEAMEDLRILFEYLEAMGKLKFVSFDLSLARGLDYYTGVIYEAVCMSGNTQVGSIGGGGRYDNLVSMFQEAGKITPCVGVSIGIERVFTLMEARLREEQGGSIKQPNVNILVATVGQGMMKERMKVAKLLWDANISAEFSQQENPKLKYEIANALDRSIPFMVIVGEEEAQGNKCKVKDLKSKTEDTVPLTDLVVTLRGKGVIPVGCEFAAELFGDEATL